MIRDLRKKFVLAAMAAFVATLVIVGVAINGGYLITSTQRADAAIEMLQENDDAFPDPKSHAPQSGSFVLTEETPFQTRYFVVHLAEDGTVKAVDTSHIASVDDDKAIQIAQSVEALGDTGYYETYRYHVFHEEDGVNIIVLDCFLQMQTGRTISLITIAVSIACAFMALAILIPLSGRVMRPFARNLDRQKRFITDASHELKTPLAIISANTDLIEALSGDLGEAARTDDEHGAETANGWKRTALERQNQPQVRTPQDDQDAQTPQDAQDSQAEQNGQGGRGGAPSELAPWITSTRTQISRLDALVRDMVELSRADEGREEGEPEELDLGSIAQQAANDFDALAATKGITLTSRISPRVYVMGTASSLTRLCGILLDNAVKYCDADGEVRISLRKRRRVVELRVSNPCATLTQDEVPHLFDRFWRADESRAREKDDVVEPSSSGGYGIGLSIAKSTVERHKGKIEAHLKEGIVTFTATLPLAK